MVLYTCSFCNYNTTIITHYNRHLQTDKHLKSKPKVSLREAASKPIHNACKKDVFICKYCNQTYKHKQSLSKHIKYSCTKNKDEDLIELVRLLNSQLEQQRNDFQSQLQSQAKQIDKLMGKLEINGSFNTTNTNTNIQNNIQLLAYKDTDISHLTEKDYECCIKKVNYCVMKMIEKIHFNPNKPENMNIYISNMKDKYLMVYDGSNWNLANKYDEVNKLYDEKEILLEEWLEENKDNELKEKFMKYLNNKETDECINRIKDEIKLMMYNKKQMIE
jgi:hypothetical protein